MDSTSRELSETEKTPYCDAGKEIMRTISDKVRFNKGEYDFRNPANYQFSFLIDNPMTASVTDRPIIYSLSLEISKNGVCVRNYFDPDSSYFAKQEDRKNLCTAYYQTLVGRRLDEVKKESFNKMNENNINLITLSASQALLPGTDFVVTALTTKINYNDHIECELETLNLQQTDDGEINYSIRDYQNPCKCVKINVPTEAPNSG